jgi:hypothetical protein
MATAAAAARKPKSRNSISPGSVRTSPARPCAARCARAARRRSMPRCAGRASRSSRSRSSGGARRQDHREGHHAVHPPARHHDEIGRAAAAGLRHRGKGHSNPRWRSCCSTSRPKSKPAVRAETGIRKHPLYFDALYCNLVGAGEAAGILDSLLDRLATYKEKILAIKSKIKSALFYPIAIIVVAFVITAVIMIFVIPAFKEVFTSFGADLPAADAVRDGHLRLLRGVLVAHLRRHRRGPLRFSGHGSARRRCRSSWTAFAAPAGFRRDRAQIVDRALDAHAVHDVRRGRAAGRSARLGGGASGNYEYYVATKKIQSEVATGSSLTSPCRAPTSSRTW